LFDIDENDFENEYSYNDDLEEADNSLMELSFHSKHNISNNSTNSYGYSSYAHPLPYGQSQQFFPSHPQPRFSDPFEDNALASITESVEHYFHTQQFGDGNMYALGQGEYLPHWGPATAPAPAHRGASAGGYVGLPSWVPVPAPSNTLPPKAPESPNLAAEPAEPKKTPAQFGCSVCLAPHPRTLAVLIPCSHPLCSGCLTSALNIVGEKDMECAVCRGKVADFKLVVGDSQNTDSPKAEEDVDGQSKTEKKVGRARNMKTPDDEIGRSFMDPLFSSPGSAVTGDGAASVNGLQSAFEFGLGLVRASTPKREERTEMVTNQLNKNPVDAQTDKRLRERGRGKGKGEENVVLRIDNVPWVRWTTFHLFRW